MSNYDRNHFERLYAAQIDPWRFRDSAYERDKYAATMQAMPRARFAKCLELGCSIGVLSKMLAGRCDAVVAVDTSETALAEARRTCAGLSIDFRQMHLPNGDLGRGFDLVVASEVLYYLDPGSLTLLARRLVERVNPAAVCIAVHWTGETDYPTTADSAIEIFEREASLMRTAHHTTRHYRLDVWTFPDVAGLSRCMPIPVHERFSS